MDLGAQLKKRVPTILMEQTNITKEQFIQHIYVQIVELQLKLLLQKKHNLLIAMDGIKQNEVLITFI